MRANFDPIGAPPRAMRKEYRGGARIASGQDDAPRSPIATRPTPPRARILSVEDATSCVLPRGLDPVAFLTSTTEILDGVWASILQRDLVVGFPGSTAGAVKAPLAEKTLTEEATIDAAELALAFCSCLRANGGAGVVGVILAPGRNTIATLSIEIAVATHAGPSSSELGPAPSAPPHRRIRRGRR